MDPKWVWDGEYWQFPSGLRDMRFQIYDEYDKQILKERKKAARALREQNRLSRHERARKSSRPKRSNVFN